MTARKQPARRRKVWVLVTDRGSIADSISGQKFMAAYKREQAAEPSRWRVVRATLILSQPKPRRRK